MNRYAHEFFNAYVECAVWSSTALDQEGTPLDDLCDASDLKADVLDEMRTDCAHFIMANRADLRGLDPAQAGHDFWLTSRGHGAGFWDRGLGEVGERLTTNSKAYPSDSLTEYDFTSMWCPTCEAEHTPGEHTANSES